MGQINGIDLGQFGGSLGGSPSPEEAAKAFMRAAGLGLAKVVQDAMTDALGQANASLGAGDWMRHVRGCVLDITFPNPPGTTIDTVTTFAGGESLGAEGSFSCGGSIRF